MKRSAHKRREAEFEEVALVHIHSLYNLALRFTRNPSDAEDLVQDTFIRAFRFFDRYEPGTNAKAWLFTILRNSFINRYRQAQRRPEEVHRTAEEQKRCRAFLHHTGLMTSDGTTWGLANLGAGVQLAARSDLRGSRVRFQGTLYPEIQTVDVNDFEPVQDL